MTVVRDEQHGFHTAGTPRSRRRFYVCTSGCKRQWPKTSTTKRGCQGYRVRRAVQKQEQAEVRACLRWPFQKKRTSVAKARAQLTKTRGLQILCCLSNIMCASRLAIVSASVSVLASCLCVLLCLTACWQQHSVMNIECMRSIFRKPKDNLCCVWRPHFRNQQVKDQKMKCNGSIAEERDIKGAVATCSILPLVLSWSRR